MSYISSMKNEQEHLDDLFFLYLSFVHTILQVIEIHVVNFIQSSFYLLEWSFSWEKNHKWGIVDDNVFHGFFLL